MTQEVKALIGIGVATVLLLVGGVLFLSNSNPTAQTTQKGTIKADILIRADDQKEGNSKAKITLIEFSDFQCPYCGATYAPTKEIVNKYKKNILFVFKHFPLNQHKNAMLAAEAAEAAGAQGKFWEMHDMLFENQTTWGESDQALDIFKTYAEKLHLNVTMFIQDVKTEKYLGKIQKNRGDGTKASVTGTPTYFLNGEQVTGYNSPSEIQSVLGKLIEEKLQ